MNDKTLDSFRHALIRNRDALLEWLDSDSSSKEIHLGGSKKTDVLGLIAELRDALERIDKREFGKCEECEGDIDPEELEMDFTSCVCLEHYTDAQLRTLEEELISVSKVQRDLLPCQVPNLPGLQIAAHTEPARVVGGDYYDFFKCHTGREGLVIADVMHKGLPASMLMSNLQASLRILGPDHPAPESLAERLNNLFIHNLSLIRFISLFLATIDLETNSLHYCNAGHHPPLWWQASSRRFNWLDPTGPALGLTHEARYRSQSIRCHPGDLFIFYTDGLVEARNHSGKEFGEERMVRYVNTHTDLTADALLNGLLGEVKRFSRRFHDDVTLMILKII